MGLAIGGMAAPGLEGYLSKQGGGTSAFGRKSWKVRYFVLSKGVLNYYEDKKAYQKGTKPLGSNHVLQIMSIKTMPEKDKKFSNQSHREIVFPNRSLVVCCDSEAILQKWVDSINAHIRAERNAGQDVEEEVTQVENEARRHITFTILLNVLKRWVTVDWARAVAAWKFNYLISIHGYADGEHPDTDRLRARMDHEKKAEMSEFAASLKQKWESAVHALKHDVQVLKGDNQRLHEENEQLRQELAHRGATQQQHDQSEQLLQLKEQLRQAQEAANHQSQEPATSAPESTRSDTIEVSREEWIAMMDAAMINSWEGEPQQQSEEVLRLKEQLQQAEVAAGKAQRDARLANERAEHLDAQLKAKLQHSVLEDGHGSRLSPLQPELRDVVNSKASTPSHHQSPAERHVVEAPNSVQHNSSWISRYKAIINSDF